MKNLNKNKVLLLILLLVGIVLFGLFTSHSYSVIPSTTVLSVDKVSFDSSNQFFNGNVFVVNAEQNGLSQTVEFSPTNLKTNSGVESNKKVSLNFEYLNQKCEYPLKIISSAGYLPVMHQKAISGIRVCNNNACYNMASAQSNCFLPAYNEYGGFCGIPRGSARCWATYPTDEWGVTPITDYNINYKIRVILTIGNEHVSAFITPNQKQVFLPSGKPYYVNGDYAFVMLKSFSSTGKACPFAVDSPYLGIRSPAGKWGFVGKPYYNYYLDQYDNQQGIKWVSDVNDWLAKVNQGADDVISHIQAGSVNTISSSQGILSTDVSNDPAFLANWYIVLRADKVGVKTQNPKPRIVSAENHACVQAGNSGVSGVFNSYFVVRVCNDGEGGLINLGGSCDNNNFRVFSQQTLLGDNECKDVKVYYTADTDKRVDSTTCSITASSIDRESTVKVKACVRGYVSCNAGQSYCGHDVSNGLDYVVGCNAEGTGYDFNSKHYCNSSQVCSNGECVSKDGGVQSQGINHSKWYLWVILAGMVLGLGYSLVTSNGEDTKALVIRTLGLTFVGFVLGFLIALLIKLIMSLIINLGGLMQL